MVTMQTATDIIFPIILVRRTDPAIYFFKKGQLGLISKGGEKFYVDGANAFDSIGNKFIIEKVLSVQRAPIGKSLRYFQQMYLAELQTKFIGNLSFSDFKQFINSHINSHKKYWIRRDLIEDLQKSVSEMDSHAEIIEYLK